MTKNEKALAEWQARSKEIQAELREIEAAGKVANEDVAKAKQIVASLMVRKQHVEKERTLHARRKPQEANVVIEKPSYEPIVRGEYPRYASERH